MPDDRTSVDHKQPPDQRQRGPAVQLHIEVQRHPAAVAERGPAASPIADDQPSGEPQAGPQAIPGPAKRARGFPAARAPGGTRITSSPGGITDACGGARRALLRADTPIAHPGQAMATGASSSLARLPSPASSRCAAHQVEHQARTPVRGSPRRARRSARRPTGSRAVHQGPAQGAPAGARHPKVAHPRPQLPPDRSSPTSSATRRRASDRGWRSPPPAPADFPRGSGRRPGGAAGTRSRPAAAAGGACRSPSNSGRPPAPSPLRRLQSGQQVQQRRLPAAGRPAKRHSFARLHRQIHPRNTSIRPPSNDFRTPR